MPINTKKSNSEQPLPPAFHGLSSAAPQEKDTVEAMPRIQLPLTRLNFILMAVAGIIIALGFILMTGEPSGADSFNPDIFSTRRIVVGPTISFIGYILMGVAIMWPGRRKPESENQPTNEESKS